MKITIFEKKIILIIIFSLSTSSCCKKYINNSNKENLNTHIGMCMIDNHILHEKKIQRLKNINTIYFDLDQYNILPQYIYILDEHASFLRKNKHNKIVIEGHADERGTPEYNIALGERRAYSVKIYLQSQGVTNDQLSIISYGKEKPVSFGHNEIDHEKNRRSVLIY